jgi:hypothetical protein
MTAGPVQAPDRTSLLVTAAIGLGAVVLFGGPSFFSVLRWQTDRAAADRCAPRFAPPTAAEPERAAELADALWANPDDSACLLGQYGLSGDDFVVLMETIAEDYDASRRYAAARR